MKEKEEDIVDAVEPETEETAETEKKERKPRKRKAAATGRGWKRWLNYQAVVRQIPFFLFLTFLAVVYIYNGHLADKTVRQIGRTSREVKELQYEYKTVKSEVMFRSKQSEMVKAVEPLGLKELLQPPVILEEKKE
ncbi:hypothetical protein LZZ85_19440 [Terrimonas sp. NA20]|uniref:Cell division protein FtsL n=1 Tax=Terrimonas ginsenosidimutans TaxID=2908004 RepID=A0ABS9KW21_9BACT|nr:hypothetical protein [Terrimonas ginsenosidimutans]